MTYGMNTIVSAYYSVQILIRAWFEQTLPDLIVQMDLLDVDDGSITYHWTPTGMNSGTGGTGRSACVSGYEE